MKKNKGLFEMLLATFIWGSVPIFAVLSNLPAPIFVFFRVLFAFPFIFYLSLKKVSIKNFFKIKPFWPLLVSGISLGSSWIFFFWALSLEEVSSVVVLYHIGPIISVVLATLFLKEEFNKKILVALIFAISGVIVSNNGFHFSVGAIIALIAGVSYGFLGFFSKIATLHHRAVIVTTYQILISIFLTAPFLFFYDFSFNVYSFIIVLIAGIVHTALALFLWYDSLNYISVNIASVLHYLNILFAMILAFLILNQPLSLNQIIGAILIAIAGIIGTKK